MTNEATKHHGSCHCGANRYQVEIDLSKGGSLCNCSICTKLAPFGAMTKPEKLVLLTPEEGLSKYVWGAAMSERFFCKTCHTYLFGKGDLPEVGGAFASINLNTLDDVEIAQLPRAYWDGRHDNWEAGVKSTPWKILEAT